MGILDMTPPKGRDWVATRWSMVSTLTRTDDEAWQKAWTYLVDAYRVPMERYVRSVLKRTRGTANAAEESSEIVQDFLARCVEKDWLSRAQKERGRFRAFLKTLLKRHTYGRLKHARAKRRSPDGGQGLFSIREDDLSEALSAEERLEFDAFDESWVRVAVDRALSSLAGENERYRDIVHDLIITDGEGSLDLAERVGVTPAYLSVLKFRARARFSLLFADELSATVGNREDFEAEWRALTPYLK